ncbi:hypothetical protein HML84_11135 [Alcanivorax sp. IO_7]|nr:hypothetical protein HML84_11135 [Alcanivorax sp. IO_7]
MSTGCWWGVTTWKRAACTATTATGTCWGAAPPTWSICCPWRRWAKAPW